MKGFLKITLLIGALTLTACSKSVNGDGTTVNPVPYPAGSTPITWDNTNPTAYSTVMFTNALEGNINKLSPTSSVVDRERVNSLYVPDALIFQNKYILVKLQNEIYNSCRGDSYEETCTDNFEKISGGISLKGSGETQCDYELYGDRLVLVQDSCELYLDKNTGSITIDKISSEINQIKFLLQYKTN